MSEHLYGRLRAWRKADPHRSLRAFLLMTALVAAVLLVITDWRKASVPLTEGLERNPYGGGSRTERLIAETENKEKTEIDVEVKEQLYTTEETTALFDKCIRQLDRLILGENKSLDYVTSDMKLVTQIPEVPVEVEWELSRYDVMNIYGEIQEDVLKEEGIQITLKAVLTYMEDRTMQAQYECMANIYPAAKTKEETQGIKIKEAIQREQEKSKTEKRLKLPATVDGENVSYYRQMEDRGLIVVGNFTPYLGCVLCG